MNFFTAIKTCFFEKFCCFKGRASRSEFWYFALAYSLVTGVAPNTYPATCFSSVYSLVAGIAPYLVPGAVFNVIALILFLPYWGVSVRRFHDTGRSGWWVFVIALVMILNTAIAVDLFADPPFSDVFSWGAMFLKVTIRVDLSYPDPDMVEVLIWIVRVPALWFLFVTICKGTSGPNRFGPDPLGTGLEPAPGQN